CGRIGPRTGNEVRGVEAVLEIHLVGAACGAEAPLFAVVGNCQRGDRAAGVVREAGAEVRDERAASELSERAFRRAGSAVAVRVARGAASGVDGVLLVVARASAGLGHEPAWDREVVRGGACDIRKRVE